MAVYDAPPVVECLPTPYLEMPLEFDQRYEDALGETRINLTLAGHEALVAAIRGECPHCGRAMAEGTLH